MILFLVLFLRGAKDMHQTFMWSPRQETLTSANISDFLLQFIKCQKLEQNILSTLQIII